MRRALSILMLCAISIADRALAHDLRACLDHPQLAGACWNIRGKVTLWNGNPSVRIWPVGTKRILGVRDADPMLIPGELAKSLSWETASYANLRVCPLTAERPGHMQIVCVASVKDIEVRPK